jgi:hypothetical protein
VIKIIWMLHVVRITELISRMGIIGVVRVLSFSRSFSVARAGLREASRVLCDIICSS